jgi:CubicO group peptidase (beta-lactamase class C family)
MSVASLSKSRLERMRRVLTGYVERQEIPGLVALVSRHDDLHVETLGTLAFGNPAPMQRDTIFRIASITKPVTAVAAMILVEECKLRLDESIEPWMPELANRRVLKAISSSPEIFSVTIPAGPSEWLSTLSVAKSSKNQADSVATEASAPQPTPIRPRG